MKLIFQKNREGKASAVNLFVNKAKNEILVLLGGDLILEENTLERLVREFKNPEVGMTGGHPFPVSQKDTGLASFAGNLLWELHHRLSLQKPKMGEVVAFRKVFRRIPIFSSVDEANIEPLIRGQGYIIKYIPSAKIYNKPPTTIKDFINQRRRIYSGHLVVKNEQSYEVSTMHLGLILNVLLSLVKENLNPKFIIMSMATVILEGFSRFLGWYDYKMGKRHTVWKIVQSTKDLN
jgi:cellulose synthase/poly-beta-1,6-N-acetylglucosamine synthase-like glycosyltransferase